MRTKTKLYALRLYLVFLAVFAFVAPALADEELYVGQTRYLSAPRPPKGIIYKSSWGTSSSYLDVEKDYGTYGAYVTVNEYFSGSQTVTATIYYEWYEYSTFDTRRYEDLEQTRYTIRCKAVDISLSTSSIELNLGDSYTLYANLSPSISPAPTVTWRSGDTSVVRVSGGRVETVGPGETYIYAKSNAGPDEVKCFVKVRDIKPTAVIIPSSTTAYVGESLSITPTLTPSNANTTFTWYCTPSSGPLSLSGQTFTGVSEGTASVYCTTANGLTSNTCRVSVVYRTPTSVALSAQSLSLRIGASQKLTATVSPSNARYTTSWKSNNPDVATVAADGTVRAVSAGTTTITVTTDNGKTASCTVTVPPDPSSVSLPSAISLYRGANRRLSYTLQPSNAYNSVVWSSSDNHVATVASDGTVTAHYPGSANITVTTHNGVSATCRVDVPEPDFNFYVWLKSGEKEVLPLTEKPSVSYSSGKLLVTTSRQVYQYAAEEVVRFSMQDDMANEAPTSISIMPSLNLNYRDYAQLDYQFFPAEYDIDTKVTWTTSDRFVAQVDANGRVYANLPGECVITATTSNGRKAQSRITVAHHDFYLIVWKPTGEQVAFLLTEHPSVSKQGETLRVETSTAEIELPLEGISRFTLADRLPEGQVVNAPYYDVNHDGRISVIDVSLLISRLGESTTTYQIKEAVDAVLRKK